MLKLGRGTSERIIPFFSIRGITITPAGRVPIGRHLVLVFRIAPRLDHGEEIDLGTVSGEAAKARARAELIARHVARAINPTHSA